MAVVLGALGGAVPAAAVWLVRALLGTGVANAQALAGASGGFALLYVVNGALSLARTALVRRVSGEVASDLRRRAHGRILAGAGSESSGSAVSAVLQDVDEIHHGIGALVGAVRLPVSIAGLAVAATIVAPSLAPWAVGLGPLVAVPTLWGGAVVRGRARAVRQARAALAALAVEQAAGAEALRTAGVVAGESVRFAAADEVDRSHRLRLDVERVVPTAAAEALAALGIGGMLWVAGQRVLEGQLDTASLVGFGVALALLARPLGQVAETWSQIQRSLAATERIDLLLLRPDAPAEPLAPRSLPPGPLGAAWRGVTASLGGRTVLDGFDLEIRPGERVVLVGPSGAGKTTALRALLREVVPSHGSISLIAGEMEVSVDQLALAELRSAVATVAQDPVLFDRSIADNVTLGRQGDPAVALALAEAAFAQDRREAIAERGRALSGGERQRVALARALHGAPRILLLDEATNQVDAARQHAMLTALAANGANRATLMVAHDLRVALLADRVVVVSEGRVVEDGPPASLMARKGAFRDLLVAAGLA